METEIDIECDPDIAIAEEIFEMILTNGMINREDINHILDKYTNHSYKKCSSFLKKKMKGDN